MNTFFNNSIQFIATVYSALNRQAKTKLKLFKIFQQYNSICILLITFDTHIYMIICISICCQLKLLYKLQHNFYWIFQLDYCNRVQWNENTIRYDIMVNMRETYIQNNHSSLPAAWPLDHIPSELQILMVNCMVKHFAYLYIYNIHFCYLLYYIRISFNILSILSIFFVCHC